MVESRQHLHRYHRRLNAKRLRRHQSFTLTLGRYDISPVPMKWRGGGEGQRSERVAKMF